MRVPARHPLALLVGLLAAFTALTLAWVRPFGWRFTGGIFPDLGDPLFNVVILRWVASRFPHGLADVWSPPFFHPTEGALALSDHLLGPGLVVWLLGPLLPTPAAGYNLLAISSFALAGTTTSWVLWRRGASPLAAFAGGAVFAFSPFRWHQLSHLAILLAAWVPLTLHLFDRLLERPGRRRALLFLAAYALHVTGGTYLAHMIHLPLLVIIGVRWRASRQAWRQRWRQLGATAAAAVAVAGAIFVPYLAWGRQLAIVREPREIFHYGATVASFLTPAPESWYATAEWLRLLRAENVLFPGILPSLLALAGAAALLSVVPRAEPLPPWRRAGLVALLLVAAAGWLAIDAEVFRAGRTEHTLDRELVRQARAVVVAAFTGAWLLHRFRRRPASAALAPWDRSLLAIGLLTAVLCFPVPYLLLAKVLPGLAGMRVPARFYVFTSFALAALAAGGLDLLRARASPRLTRWAAPTLALLLLGELAPRPPRWHFLPRSEEELPAVTRWLAGAPEVAALLELPLAEPTREIPRMYLASWHGKPIANGYSGHLPPTHRRLHHEVGWPPEPQDLAVLRAYGISHLLVHVDEVGRWSRRFRRPLQRFEGWALDRPGGVALAFVDDHHLVYRLLAPAERADLAGDPP